eukprot:TRINITY_DN30018_c0_g2_i3.p1 TRINITY_DN30018_c0_g2~~TRINITY_DN30018_c0_g2_i3.p1  ORF type:complete len:372 (-),score=43.81 TRINITY_DN30018_c0_g2_i3:19-1134(-)
MDALPAPRPVLTARGLYAVSTPWHTAHLAPATPFVSRQRPKRRSKRRCQVIPSQLDYAASMPPAETPDLGPLVGSFAFVVFSTFAGIAFMEGRRGEARQAGMSVVKAYSRLENLSATSDPEETLRARTNVEGAKKRLADIRRLRIGPFDIELLPNVKQIEVGAEHHPSALRNRGPILEKLKSMFPADLAGDALEVASCSGAHLEVIAPAFPDLRWQPSDVYSRGSPQLAQLDENCCKRCSNVLPAASLDASAAWQQWPQDVLEKEGGFCLVFASNFSHCTPWAVTTGLLAGASKALSKGGSLVMYGPFKRDGRFVTDNDAAFDESLRSQNKEFGYRDVADVVKEASSKGLTLTQQEDMPSANLLLRFTKQA